MAQTEITPMDMGSRRKLHAALHIDMTPMVDLGFLLITFFIFTTAMTKPTTMSLVMPKEGPPLKLAESKVLTMLLNSNDQVYAYQGLWENAVKEKRIKTASYDVVDGIGKIIRENQNRLFQQLREKGRQELMLLIKPSTRASYKNLIDALDEAVINNVSRYAVVAPSPEEIRFMEAGHYLFK